MNKKTFSEESVDRNPFIQFGLWYDEHLKAGYEIPDSVSLGTATLAGHVSVRTVLLKGYDEKGFTFFTNYNSRKAIDLLENPFAAMLFYWAESGRQVRIEGQTEKISEKESDEYFSSRPRESQISAWASEQSSIIPGRLYLENRMELFKKKFLNREIEKPPHWGGFRLIPGMFEFWSDGEFRLHDRLVYTLTNNKWVINRLAP